VELRVDAENGELILRPPAGAAVSIRVDPAVSTQPYLDGQRVLYWPPVQSPGFDIFVGNIPQLVLRGAMADAASVDRCSVTVTLLDQMDAQDNPATYTAPLFHLLRDHPAQKGVARIPLDDSRLLGPGALGRFALHVRGRLGAERRFRFCVLPQFRLDCPLEQLVPDPHRGHGEVRLRLHFDQPVHIEAPACVDRPAHFHSGADYELVVPSDCTRCPITVELDVSGKSSRVPLEITVPRVEWALVGLRGETELRYWDTCREVALQDLEAATEPILYLQAHLDRNGEGPQARAVLDYRTDQQVKEVRLDGRGRGAVRLKEFLTTLQAGHAAIAVIRLELAPPGGPTMVRDLLRVATLWLPQDVQARLVREGSRPTLHVNWRDQHPLSKRQLRLWREGRLLHQTIVPDGVSEASLCDAGGIADGNYRLEFAVADDWSAGEPAHPADPFAETVRDLSVHGSIVECQDSLRKHLEDFLDAIAEGRSVKPFAVDRLVVDLPQRPEIMQRFCRAVTEREQLAGNGAALLCEILGRVEYRDGELHEALAAAVDSQFTDVLWEALLERGLGQRAWGKYLEGLITRRAARARRGSAGSTALRELYARVDGFYQQAIWASPDFATRFLSGLLAARKGLLRWNRYPVEAVRSRHVGARTPLWVFYPGGNVCLLARNWHQVRPSTWTAQAGRYALTGLQRGLALGMVTYPPGVSQQLDDLGRDCYRLDARLYLKALLEAEKALRDWLVPND
jgi:hypothetical protein